MNGIDCGRLDNLSDAEARAALLRCCGSTRWVEAMLAARPFGALSRLYQHAARSWRALDAKDWHEAFSHHPRIGDAKAAAAGGTAAKEQAGAAAAPEAVKQALAEGNKKYEAKFGHIYLVCATGKTGLELLAILEQRLKNEPGTELRVAAREQEKITQLRLEKLLRGDTP